MLGVIVDNYKASYFNGRLRISCKNGSQKWTVSFFKNDDDPSDYINLNISDLSDHSKQLTLESKYYRLIIMYDEADGYNITLSNNSRIELYERDSEADEFVNVLFITTGIPQSVVERLMEFIQHPEQFEISLENFQENEGVHNNSPQNEDPSGNVPSIVANGGARRHLRKNRTKKIRKQRNKRT